MYGKYSWRIEGSSDENVTIAQLLSKESVEYIRNRKDSQQRGVCFSFWYNKPATNQNVTIAQLLSKENVEYSFVSFLSLLRRG